MKKASTLVLILLLFGKAFGQFVPAHVKLKDDLNTVNNSIEQKLGKKGGGTLIACQGDTLDYARYKASAYTGINISTGYRLGQYFEAPGEVTVSGFDFYAWQSMQSKAVVAVYAQLYEAGADSLPYGNAIRTDTIFIDSTFGGGVLTKLQKRAVFSTPYTTTKPFIIVLVSNDTNRVAVVTNSYQNGDGDNENLGCGSIGGRWYQFDDLNIGGVPLNCDVVLEPFVNYKLSNNFSFKDCYTVGDTVKFKNESSDFYFSKVYNRYIMYGLDLYCHRWDYYGNNASYYSVEGKNVYTVPTNARVRLISTIYTYRGNYSCIDTTYKDIAFQPSDINFSGDKNICSGNYGNLMALTSGLVSWYRSPLDTAFLAGPAYQSASALEQNDTLYAKSINKQCSTKLKSYIIEVTKTPGEPEIHNDSICLNSLANLTADPDYGIVRWFEDSTTILPIYTGSVYQVGPLNHDTFFYAQAFNGQCTHNSRVKVSAFVSNDFAPQAPTVSNDTVVCLLSDPFYLRASSSSNQLRWYSVAAGGSVKSTADSFLFTPKTRGKFNMYVDAYNGNCASSRLPISVDVQHFPTIIKLNDLSGCTGDTLLFNQANQFGEVEWFSSESGGNPIFTGWMRTFDSIHQNQTYYLQPFEGNCRDSIRHSLNINNITYPVVTESVLDKTACDGFVPTLHIKPDVGIVNWYSEDGEKLLASGEDLVVAPITDNIHIQYSIDNQGCVSGPYKHDVEWLLMPDANFDYQITWRNVDFASRLIGQGNYIWYFGDGSDTLMGTDVKHYYAVDGTYDAMLIVESFRGCIDTVTKKITIDAVGINNISKDGFKVYPNPVGVNETLTLDGEKIIGEIIIYEITGKEILRTKPYSSKVEMRLPELSSGNYWVKIIGTDNSFSVFKLSVQ
ncbi:MAG: T9SS type A sorting domain-containing protein [Bacteroidetes bacterium]|nr:T9SS type A sorting domain-containing protein [Bacteroidota bacterium]